jgi:hypothetical protein
MPEGAQTDPADPLNPAANEPSGHDTVVLPRFTEKDFWYTMPKGAA